MRRSCLRPLAVATSGCFWQWHCELLHRAGLIGHGYAAPEPGITLHKRRHRREVWYNYNDMTKMMKEAIEALRGLPEERQETVARAILDYASDDERVYHLTGEERREVRAGLAEIARGEIASDREVAAVLKRIGV